MEHKNTARPSGKVIQLAVCTRPDITFAVNTIVNQVQMPILRNAALLKRLLRFVSGTRFVGIKFTKGIRSGMNAYVDPDWTGEKDSRKSKKGFVVLINDAPINWKRQKQTVIALSSAEPEYAAFSSCVRELLWTRRFHAEKVVQQIYTDGIKMKSTAEFVDSAAAISIENSVILLSKRVRGIHIDIKGCVKEWNGCSRSLLR